MRFRDFVRNTLGDLDNPEPQQQTSGKPRVHFDPQPEVKRQSMNPSCPEQGRKQHHHLLM